MGLDLRASCSKCHKILQSDEIRAVGNGKYQCISCYEGTTAPSFKAGFSPRSTSSSSSTPMPVSSFSEASHIEPVKNTEQFFANKDYSCNACGFQFTREPTKVIDQCPYCGKAAVQEKVEDVASQFIQ